MLVKTRISWRSATELATPVAIKTKPAYAGLARLFAPDIDPKSIEKSGKDKALAHPADPLSSIALSLAGDKVLGYKSLAGVPKNR